MKVLKNFNGFKLVLDDQGSGNEKMLLKMDNPVEDYVFKGFGIKQDDTIIDIGAHIGRLSVYAATHGKVVYAYEPDKRNIAKLVENIQVNNLKNLNYFEMAVNGTGENVTFYFSDNPSENSLFEKNKDLPHTEVKGVTLKNIFETNNINKCNFLKIDCEGAEYEILRTLPKEYFKKIDKIVLEYHDHLVKGSSLKDLVLVLTKNNFRISKITRGAWYTGLLYAKKSRVKPFIYNYLKVYIFDMALFILSLIKKKIVKQ